MTPEPGLVAPILNRSSEPFLLRQRAAQALGFVGTTESRGLILEALTTAHHRLAIELAAELGKTAEGAEMFLTAVGEGKVSPTLLQDARVLRHLDFSKLPNLNERVGKLTEELPPEDEASAALIQQRRRGFLAAEADAAEGKKVYEKHCAICHQLDGEGAKLGPDLDGIGLRGLDRLLEDVLDPNRNVDPTFRSTVVATDDGLIQTGLAVRDEGEVLILADSEGKEQRIEHDRIDERFVSPLSPMPSVATQLITEPEFYHVMAFLLEETGGQESEVTGSSRHGPPEGGTPTATSTGSGNPT
jgi:putative heme-binding domain-containing protein